MNEPKPLSAVELNEIKEFRNRDSSVMALLDHISHLDDEIGKLTRNREWVSFQDMKDAVELCRAENEKKDARISELEAGLKSIKSLHSHVRSCVFVNDEWDCELNSVEAIAHSLLSPKDTQEIK